MYALLTSKESLLPTVINQNSRDYCDLIMSGLYIEEDTGHKIDMEEKADEILRGIYGDLQHD